MLKWSGDTKHSLFLETHEQGSADYRGSHYPIVNLLIRAELDNRGVDFEKAELQLGQNNIELSGRLDDFTSLIINGDLQADLELNDVCSFLSIERAFSGKSRNHFLEILFSIQNNYNINKFMNVKMTTLIGNLSNCKKDNKIKVNVFEKIKSH